MCVACPSCPRAYERVCLAALVLVFAIILTGAAVRLTGSGLGGPNWPKCGGGYVAPLELHAWIEYGNRLITGLVGLPCLATFILAYRRRPYRRDLRRLSMFLPLGVLAQAVLGGFTVMYDLKPGFVMSHFLLSQAILAVAVALWWRARHEPDTRPRSDRQIVWATRALLPMGALVLFAGTLTTAAGPHPGSRATGEIVPGSPASASTRSTRCTIGMGVPERCSACSPSPPGSWRAGCAPGRAFSAR